MKVALITSALAWASCVASSPGFAARRQRVVEPGNRRTTLPQVLDSDVDPVLAANETDTNWAGAFLIGTGYTTVSGTIVIPKPSMPAGGSSATTYSASAWVGIDGKTCEPALLQTGVDLSIKGGTVTYEAWYEWYPDISHTFSDFKVSEGDTVTMTVTATGKNNGSAILDNITTGQSVSHTFINQAGNLCNTNAEWIVEDFQEGDSWVPFANFGTVVFTNATVNGASELDKASTADIQQGDTVYTSCSILSSSSVSCSYIG